jgi:hypothetical protein
MQGVEDGQRGKQGEGVGQKNSIHESAVRICTCMLTSNEHCV